MLRLTLITTVLLALGCGNYHEDYGPSASTTLDTQGFSTLSFASVKALVLQAHCLPCHSQAAGNVGGINLETYANVFPLVQEIQSAVSSNHMPLGGAALPANEKAILFAWINDHAPETSSLPLPGTNLNPTSQPTE